MSVKELIVIPKQKFESLTNSFDNNKETQSVGCQTDANVNATSPESDDINSLISTNNTVNEHRDIVVRRIKDGIPGQLHNGVKGRRSRKIKWIPY